MNVLRAAAWAGLASGLLAAPVGAEPTTREEKHPMQVSQAPWGQVDGQEASLFTCDNGSGITLKLTDYGARIVALEMPDRQGKVADVTLGFDSLEAYVKHKAYFGCTTGRFANRIAQARFQIDGQEYQVAKNIGENHLHGGLVGFDRKVWKSELVRTVDGVGVTFTLHSPDGDEGYPGALDATVTYMLDDRGELRLEYTARTDKPTVLNLTNHAYWNLAGTGDVLQQRLTVDADQYVAIDDQAIPTGKLADVSGTPLDFTSPHTIGERMAQMKQGVPAPGGYDHCYVVRGQAGKLRPCAKLEDPASGRVMEVSTTEPGVQVYSSNFLDGSAVNGGFKQHAALCLETQHLPDSPNQPSFPTTVLRPGETYRQTTIHRFSVTP